MLRDFVRSPGTRKVSSGSYFLPAPLLRANREQIWNKSLGDAICGDNLRGDGLIRPCERIGSPQQGGRGPLRADPAFQIQQLFGAESGDGGKRQQGHSGWKSRQGS